MALVLKKELPDIETIYRMWTHSDIMIIHYNTAMILQLNAPYRQVLTPQLNHLASLAKWLSVRLQTNWLWV